MELKVDQELKSLIPPLREEEFNQLEENIVKEGCREAIVHWGGIILDGHNRFEICSKHGLGYKTKGLEFQSREDAMDWMDRNQVGRRNLTPDQMSLIRGRIYNRRKGDHGGDRKSEKSSGQNVHSKPTHEQLGDQFGVSGKTIQRDGKFAESIDSLKGHVTDIEQRVMSGEVKRRDVMEAASDPEKAEERLSHNHRAQGTGQNEWYTPTEYVEAARDVLGEIDLDPASSDKAQEAIKASRHYTIDDDGLEQKWEGRVWLNPPYAQPHILNFVEKLCVSIQHGVTEAIMLTHNYTDTRWFQMAARTCSAICFTRGRISFVDPDGKKAAPTQGQAFFYFGDDPEKFSDAFSRFGFVAEVKGFQDEHDNEEWKGSK